MDAAEVERIAKAKAACPVFSRTSNVIRLSLVWRRPWRAAANLPRNSAEGSSELEAAKNEFRELLIVGGITPATADKRIEEVQAAHGEVAALKFMRGFVASQGKKIREERRAARTSGALAASVRWFKPVRAA